LKEEALDRILWRTRFGRGYGPVVRQTAEWMNVQKCGKPPTCFSLFRPFYVIMDECKQRAFIRDDINNHLRHREISLKTKINFCNRRYCIFCCWIPSWRWPEKAETCMRFTTCLYITVSYYSAVVGLYMVTWIMFMWLRIWLSVGLRLSWIGERPSTYIYIYNIHIYIIYI
jgi:hypothetical protein